MNLILLKLKKAKNYTFFEILRYFYEKIYKKIFKILNHSFFNNLDNTWNNNHKYYVIFIKKLLINKKYFLNFKRNPCYRTVLEHVTYKQGLDYLIEIKTNTKFLKNINKFLINDKTGNPINFYYKLLDNKVSPNTLRYIKVASDIEKYFGNRFNNIVEIGPGYGGQYIILDIIFKIQNYIFFDIEEANSLLKKNLQEYKLNSSFYFGNMKKKIDNIDLIISNFSFSELPKQLQRKYLEDFISKSKNGYMTMNSGLKFYDDEKHLSFNEIKNFIPQCKIIEEKPETAKQNYIIIW